MKFFVIIFFTLLSIHTLNAENIDALVKNIKSVCISPDKESLYWEVKGQGNADVNIKLIGANLKGKFTKQSWEGVQKVLKEQQASDNKDYRDCVEKLTPIFLSNLKKETTSSNNTNVNQQSENGEFINDKKFAYDISYNLKNCKQFGEEIKCYFTLINTSNDKKVSLSTNSFIIDSEGEQYYAKSIKFGRTEGTFPTKLMVKDIPIKVELRFNKVKSRGNKIPLLKFISKINYRRSILEFRNIPLMQ